MKGLVSRREAAAAQRGMLLMILLAFALALLGCGSRQDPSAKTPAQRAQELIDSGNQAFRAGNYGLAARRYAAAAVERKDDPAAYYGMAMALSKLGRDEEARKAYAKAGELARSGHH